MSRKKFFLFVSLFLISLSACSCQPPPRLSRISSGVSQNRDDAGSVTQACLDQGWSQSKCMRAVDLANKIYHSTVHIINVRYWKNKPATYGISTGSIVGDSLVLTANHSIKHSYALFIIPRQPIDQRQVPKAAKRYWEAEVVRTDPGNDLAVIRPKDSSVKLGPSLLIREKPLEIGEEVWNFGRTTYVSFGTVFSSNGLRSTLSKLLLTSAATDYGDSGGPLVDWQGMITGVIIKKLPRNNSPNFAYGLAVPTDKIFPLLNNL